MDGALAGVPVYLFEPSMVDRNSASWVIVCLTTGVALFETFEHKTASKIESNPGVRVVPIREYLESLNA